jgi:hypothetical protein
MNEHIATHDTFGILLQLLFWKVGHIKKMSHLLLCHIRRQVGVLITTDNFRTLLDIVIANSTCLDMVHCASCITTHATTIVIQEKT